MLTKLLNKIAVCVFLCTLLTNISSSTTTDSDSQDPNCVSEHKELFDILGLSEDANDSEIVQLLDDPEKRTFATLLIRYRKISSAIPKLLQIVGDVNDSDATIFAKIAAAKALCDFGNKEWMPVIKALSTDPNSVVSRRTPQKIEVAGLLASGGDYSQFEIVANSIGNSKRSIRLEAITALGKFGHKTNPVTDSAAELLMNVANSDSIPWLRERAIESLEKIAKTKPEVESKVIAALEANKDSSDKNLQIMCRAKLKMYDKNSKTKDK